MQRCHQEYDNFVSRKIDLDCFEKTCLSYKRFSVRNFSATKSHTCFAKIVK